MKDYSIADLWAMMDKAFVNESESFRTLAQDVFYAGFDAAILSITKAAASKSEKDRNARMSAIAKEMIAYKAARGIV